MTGRNIEEIEKEIRQNLQPKKLNVDAACSPVKLPDSPPKKKQSIIEQQKLKVDAACSPVKFPDQPKSKKRSINEILMEE